MRLWEDRKGESQGRFLLLSHSGDGTSIKGELFPPFRQFRVEFKSTITLRTKSVLSVFFLAEFHLCTETVGTFQIGQHFLEMTPLCPGEFHRSILLKIERRNTV